VKSPLTKIMFKERSHSVWGDRYDYSVVTYGNMHTPVKIRCKKHDITFSQSPANHLAKKEGCGTCKQESKAERISRLRKEYAEIFFKTVKSRFKNKFDYSHSVYIDKDKPIKIICPVHGEFTTTPSTHKKSLRGCKRCRFDSPQTNKEFLQRAILIHSDKYSYKNAKFKNMTLKVEIICDNHGPFSQTPSNHLLGQGCNKCADGKRGSSQVLNTKIFISRAKTNFGDEFDYSKTVYVNNHTNVIVICKTHGSFETIPANHIRTIDPIRGCKKCANEKLKEERSFTTEQFIDAAKKVHSNRYDYSKVEYVNARTEVIVICSQHGEFPQTPDPHINKKVGCPECGKEIVSIGTTLTEYRKSDHKQLANIYLVSCWNDHEKFLKIGITTKRVVTRFGGQILPYEFEILFSTELDLGDAYELEQKVLSTFKKKYHYYPQIGFGGRTECFKTSALKEILRFIKTR
jgi:hypothetical protein